MRKGRSSFKKPRIVPKNSRQKNGMKKNLSQQQLTFIIFLPMVASIYLALKKWMGQAAKSQPPITSNGTTFNPPHQAIFI